MNEGSRSGLRRAMTLAVAVGLAVLAVACDGGSSSPAAAGDTAYQIAAAYARSTPFIGMARALARTCRLKVGTGVAMVPGRRPVLVDRAARTLGPGWPPAGCWRCSA